MIRKIILGGTAVALLLAAISCFLLFTEKGLQALVAGVEKTSQQRFKVGFVAGSLIKGIHLQQIVYSSAGSTVSANKFSLNWQPVELFNRKLHLTSFIASGITVNASAVAKEQEESEKKGDFILPDIDLPLSLLVDMLEIEDLTFLENDKVVSHINKATVKAASARNRIDIEKILLAADEYELSGRGNVTVSGAWPVDISGEWKYYMEGSPDVSGKFTVFDSLKDGGAEVLLVSPAAVKADMRFSVQRGISLVSHLVVSDFDPSLYVEDYPGSIDVDAELSAEIAGGGTDVHLKVKDISGRLRSYPLQGQAILEYDGHTFSVSTIELSSKNTILQAEGKVGGDIDLGFSLNSPQIDDIIAGVDGAVKARGHVQGSLARPEFSFELEGKNISAGGVVAGSMAVLAKGEGGVNGRVELQADANTVTYNDQQVDAVSVTISGDVAEHRVAVTLDKDEISAVFAVAGGSEGKKWMGRVHDVEITHGKKGVMRQEKTAALMFTPGEVSLEQLCLFSESTKVCGSGFLKRDAWKAEISLSAFDPAFFFPEWPGSVNAILQAHGELNNGSLKGNIELERLHGSLKDQSITGSGLVRFEERALFVDQLRVEYGGANTRINGILGNVVDLSFSGELPDVSTVVPEAEGQMSFSGQISGSPETPAIQLDLQALDVQHEGIAVKELRGNVEVDLQPGGQIAAQLTAQDIITNDLSVYDAEVMATGKAENHSFNIRLSSNEGHAAVQGRGSYGQGWKGQLDNALLTDTRFGSFQLEDMVQVSVAPDKLYVDNLCLLGDGVKGCLNAGFSKGEGLVASGNITELSLQWLGEENLLNLPMQGSVSGVFSFDRTSEKGIRFSAKSEADDLALSGVVEGQPLKYHFTDSSLQVELLDSHLDISLLSNLQGGGIVRSDVRVKNVLSDQTQFSLLPIDGELSLTADDLSLVTLLTSSQVEPAGRLKAELEVAGILSAPIIDGKAWLENGKVILRGMGITLKGVTLALDADSTRTDFQLAAQSGPGSAVGTGSVSFDEKKGWELTGKILGSDFEILNTDEYVIRVNGDIEFAGDKSRGELKGSVVVPYARIRQSGKSSRVTPSGDVVILDNEGANQSRWQLFTNLDVALGEDVQINAYGLKSRLVGSLSLADQPGKIFSADGELDVVDGKFSLYGTELEIDRGRLLFAGGSVENPGVDFRAQRIVEKKVVGVNVSGSADDLQFELFSDPVMEESNIIAYIIVGRSIYSAEQDDQSLIGAAATAIGLRRVNEITSSLGRYLPIDEIYLDGSSASEDMSLVFGKYITEDLFIGYDYDLFNATGEFRVLYKLGKGFSVETKTSVNSTSGDLLYSIEQ